MTPTATVSKAIRKGVVCLALILLLLVSCLSVNHLGYLGKRLAFSATTVGLLGLLTVFWIVLTLSWGFTRQTILVFVLFFFLGLKYGPFLEPPADSFEHLRLTHSYSEKKTNELQRLNSGLWHYSMASVIIQSDYRSESSDRILARIDSTHALFTGLLLAALFVMAKRVGIPARWAFFSCLIALLFFGTNRFSFFKYYSLAPSSTSMLIFWLWVSVFFFKKGIEGTVQGIGAALLCLPILVVNHLQEAVFLILAVFVWGCLNVHVPVWRGMGASRITKGLYLLVLFGIFFLLPQWSGFQDWISEYFVRDLWRWNKVLAVRWGEDYHLIGKVWQYRINDTLGSIGIILLLLAFPFFWPGFIRKKLDKKIRVYLLAILPFIAYFVPLLNYIWGANVWKQEYYRLCYSSIFWLFFAFFCWGMEGRVLLYSARLKRLVSQHG